MRLPHVLILLVVLCCPVILPAADARNASTASDNRQSSQSQGNRPGTTPAQAGAAHDAQAMLDDLMRKHPELKARPSVPAGAGQQPGGTVPSGAIQGGHCTATVNGKTVYDGPGSSVSAKVNDDGSGSRHEVTVDGKRVQGQ